MTAAMTAPVLDVDTVPEPHAERSARPGEFCDFCVRRAFVVYLLPGGATVRWCGRPERDLP